MSSRGAQQALVAGRLVTTLNQRSGLPELGLVCANAPAPAVAIAGLASSFGAKSSGLNALEPSSNASTGWSHMT